MLFTACTPPSASVVIVLLEIKAQRKSGEGGNQPKRMLYNKAVFTKAKEQVRPLKVFGGILQNEMMDSNEVGEGKGSASPRYFFCQYFSRNIKI